MLQKSESAAALRTFNGLRVYHRIPFWTTFVCDIILVMNVTLIVTVKNEASSLPRLLDSIAAQTRAPEEIVIVDGGSTDDTLEILNANMQRLPLKIISRPGANISQGRNAAIAAATHEIICATDAGVRLDEHWVEELLNPFEDLDADERGLTRMNAENYFSSASVRVPIDIVSGFFMPDPHGAFETALAAATLPALADIRPASFLPSSRSIAFRKSAWEKVNGYPEWLDYCEDLIFDFALRDAGCVFAFAPRAIVYFRPRPHLRAFIKQYYHYARGDGKANLWFKRHVIRYATYLVALPLLIALLFFVPLLGFGFLILGFIGMFFTPFKRLVSMLHALSWLDRMRAFVWVPIIRIAGDIAKTIGYPVGVAWRNQYRKGSL